MGIFLRCPLTSFCESALAMVMVSLLFGSCLLRPKASHSSQLSKLPHTFDPIDLNLLFFLPEDAEHFDAMVSLDQCSGKEGSRSCWLAQSLQEQLQNSSSSHIVNHPFIFGKQFFLNRPDAILKILLKRSHWKLVSLTVGTENLSRRSSQLRLVFQPLYPISQLNRNFQSRIEEIRKNPFETDFKDLGFSARDDGTVVTPMDIVFGRKAVGVEWNPQSFEFIREVRASLPAKEDYIAEDQAIHLVFDLQEDLTLQLLKLLLELSSLRKETGQLPKKLMPHSLLQSTTTLQEPVVKSLLDFVRQLLALDVSLGDLEGDLLLMTTQLTAAGQSWSFSGSRFTTTDQMLELNPLTISNGHTNHSTSLSAIRTQYMNGAVTDWAYESGKILPNSSFDMTKYLIATHDHQPFYTLSMKERLTRSSWIHIAQKPLEQQKRTFYQWSSFATEGFQWSEDEWQEFERKVALQASLESKVGAAHCLSCHAVDAVTAAHPQLLKRRNCLLMPYWAQRREACEQSSPQQGSVDAVGDQLDPSRGDWSGGAWMGLSAERKVPVLDLFVLRHFGYYLTFPTVSSIKQIRSIPQTRRVNKLAQALSLHL